jgi:hypothetical protein
MVDNTSNLVALIRALLVGLGCGFVVYAIGNLIKPSRKGVFAMLGVGVALIFTVILFFVVWPPPELIEVPDLSGLSRAEARLELEKNELEPEAVPQHNADTKNGYVIPGSQEPSAGTKVDKGAVIRFSVSLGPDEIPEGSVSLFRPKSGEGVLCTRYGDGVYRFSVAGTSSGLSDEFRLLLWVKPVNPPSDTPGWYLQRLPNNGIGKVNPDGSWEGIAQIGNVQWPPHAGDVLDVAVTAVNIDNAKKIEAEPGVITRIDLPGVASDIASGVRVELK